MQQINRSEPNRREREEDARLEPLLTPAEAAKILRVSVSFVREHADELGAIRMGGGESRTGCLRFQESGLRKFIDSNAVGGEDRKQKGK